VDVAGDDVENVVRRVTFLVVGADVGGLELVEDVQVADDGEAYGLFV